MEAGKSRKTIKALVLIASLLLMFGLLPLPAMAAGDSTEKDVKIVSHDPYKHAKDSYVRQAWGPNTVLIHCDWEYELPVSVGNKQVCQFHEWPLIVMSRPDDYYDGTAKEAYFNWMTMKEYPFGDQFEGFPYDFAEWDGKFTYTGINGTVEYGPTDKAPIGEGTYYVYAKVRIPSAVTMFSDATFILGKTFTIEPSAYNLKFDANAPNSASTTVSGTMPELHFNSTVETRQLPPNQFTLDGYKFDSWNTKEDGSGKRYEDNALVKDLSYAGKDVTLYAQWKAKTYEITYFPGDASGSSVPGQAVFDTLGTLKPVSEMGWAYENHRFLGWKVGGLPLLLDDEDDFVNLCGKITAYGGNPDNVELTAQWVENGQIVVVVTKDGEPQAGLESGFSLKSSNGTIFTMSTTYEDGKYVFDPSRATSHGGTPSALPPDEYDLYFKIEPIPDSPGIPGSFGYPETSAHITYGGTSAASAVFDYYTVSMVKEPDSSGIRDIAAIENGGAALEAFPGELRVRALDGAKIQLQTTVKSGYHFDGYSAVGVAPSWDEDDPMKATQVVTLHGQATITAHSAINTYTVRFDANTRTAVIGEMEDQDMVYDEPQKLFGNQFIRADATFTGWNTEADGSGTAYADAQSVEKLTTEDGGVVTLYAQWEKGPAPAERATLTFDLAGGKLDGKTGEITVSVNVGDTIEIPSAPTREGYTFKYWKGSQYQPGDSYEVAGDHTFTAVWEGEPAPAEKATLTFDLAGGTLDGKTGSLTIEANVGDTIEIPAAPTREGYTFKYWKGSQYQPGDSYEVAGDHTFTAVWEKNSNDDPHKEEDSGGTSRGPSRSPRKRGLLPSTGDALGTTVAALAATVAGALCLAVVAVLQSRRRSLR